MLLSGCSDDDGCAGRNYQPDLSQQGAASPIEALEAWLSGDTGFATLPADDSWIQQNAGADATTVTIESDDGDGWWVRTVQTEDGGWVVDQATDQANDCDDLSGS